MSIARLFEGFTAWVRTQPDIHAVALVGSYARNAATEQSDVDLLILSTEVEKYFQSSQWVSLFGEVDSYEVESWGRVETLRAFYKSAIEVEYNFSTPGWSDLPADEGTRRVVIDGMKILFDPQGILERLQETISAGK
jgi:uncharacterized protein